jgi:hypothetical protein
VLKQAGSFPKKKKKQVRLQDYKYSCGKKKAVDYLEFFFVIPIVIRGLDVIQAPFSASQR